MTDTSYQLIVTTQSERKTEFFDRRGYLIKIYFQFDGVHVVSGSLDTSIRVWDVDTGTCKHALMGHQSLTSGEISQEARENITQHIIDHCLVSQGWS